MSHHNKRGHKSFNVFMNLIIVILIAVILVCVYFLGRQAMLLKIGETAYQKLAEQVVQGEKQELKVDFAKLKEINPDVVGWIYCAESSINYPVVQCKDNVTYSHKLFDGSNNPMGTIYMDCGNGNPFQDDNTVIYGHNMINGSMFGPLDQYNSQEYYDAHSIWYFLTEDATYAMYLIGGHIISDRLEIGPFLYASEKERNQAIDKIRENSFFESKQKQEGKGKIVTLSTSAYNHDDTDFLLQGWVIKLTDEEE